ncbi:MAG: hypothetical protein ACW98J_02880 [Candidatus Thorarchaeota archaeon]|jgi:hypothetical protein
MNDDEAFFLFGKENPSIYPIMISSIIAVIVTAVFVWLFFEAIRLVQTGDYSLFVILLVFVSGAGIITYIVFLRENEEDDV